MPRNGRASLLATKFSVRPGKDVASEIFGVLRPSQREAAQSTQLSVPRNSGRDTRNSGGAGTTHFPRELHSPYGHQNIPLSIMKICGGDLGEENVFHVSMSSVACK